MKFVTFVTPESPRESRLGAVTDGVVIDLQAAQGWAHEHLKLPPEPLPRSVYELLSGGVAAHLYARNLMIALEGIDVLSAQGSRKEAVGRRLAEVILYPPLPRPMSVRDFYAFEQHVRTAHANRGKEVPAEWYEFPVFYFTNPNAVYGPNETIPYPKYTQALDYELEIACVIGKAGRDIRADEAEAHIFGYLIMNDWSARDIQRKEMKMLGPAKAKDFATSLGPWLVTPDELRDRATERPGVFDLSMVARVNGEERSRGNFKDIHFSFGEMIAHASADAFLMPGDVLGSGTVGTGCLLELTTGEGPWLQPGDVVELEIERLGVLRNRIASRQ